MNADITLRDMREIIRHHLDTEGPVIDGPRTTLVDLAFGFRQLDQHLTNGGPLPADWRWPK